MQEDFEDTDGIFLPLDRYRVTRIVSVLPDGKAVSWLATDQKGKHYLLRHYTPAAHPFAELWLARAWEGWAKVVEVRSGGDLLLVIREWVEGPSFQELIKYREESPREDVTHQLFAELCDKVQLLSREGGVHAAIKPTNLFLSHEVIITDPSLTRRSSKETKEASPRSFLADPAYLSPEQLQQQELTPATDVYSLGCVLFEWLTGRPPFPGDSPVLVCYKHLSELPPNVRTFDLEVSERLDATVCKCLAKKPHERFADPGVLARELRGEAPPIQLREKEEVSEPSGELPTQTLSQQELDMVLSKVKATKPDTPYRTMALSVSAISEALKLAHKEREQPEAIGESVPSVSHTGETKRVKTTRQVPELLIILIILAILILLLLLLRESP